MATDIKTLLHLVINKNNNWHVQLLRAWPDIVGKLKPHVQLLKIYNDTLIIGVPDSCWMHELYLLSNVLIAAINKKLDQPRIKTVRFKTVEMVQKKNKEKNVANQKEHRTVEINAREKKALEKISDTELQRVLHNYLVRCYQERT